MFGETRLSGVLAGRVLGGHAPILGRGKGGGKGTFFLGHLQYGGPLPPPFPEDISFNLIQIPTALEEGHDLFGKGDGTEAWGVQVLCLRSQN